MIDMTEGEREVVDGLREMLQMDGADLKFSRREGSTLYFDLVVADTSCLDCIMPPEHIETVILNSLTRVTGDVQEVKLSDPRVVGGGLE